MIKKSNFKVQIGLKIENKIKDQKITKTKEKNRKKIKSSLFVIYSKEEKSFFFFSLNNENKINSSI